MPVSTRSQTIDQIAYELELHDENLAYQASEKRRIFAHNNGFGKEYDEEDDRIRESVKNSRLCTFKPHTLLKKI